MGTRAEYTECMTPHMKGLGKTKEQRQRSMCLGAKFCSGKASSTAEAEKLCDEAAANPKPPKAPRRRRGKGGVTDLVTLSTCVSRKIKIDELTPENLITSLHAALESCSVGATGASDYKKFMRDCVKTNTVTNTFPESIKLVKQCEINWREQQMKVS